MFSTRYHARHVTSSVEKRRRRTGDDRIHPTNHLQVTVMPLKCESYCASPPAGEGSWLPFIFLFPHSFQGSRGFCFCLGMAGASIWAGQPQGATTASEPVEDSGRVGSAHTQAGRGFSPDDQAPGSNPGHFELEKSLLWALSCAL